MSIKQFDRQILRSLRTEVANELAALCKRHGLQVELKGGRFDTLMWAPKLTFTVVGKGGVNLFAKETFEQFATQFGLTPEDFGREITLRGVRYKIIGINPRKYKYPVEIEEVNNPSNKRVCTASAVRVCTASAKARSPSRPVGLTREIVASFLQLAGELSPENLTCDGELPARLWRIKERELRAKWAQLEAKVGRRVSEDEVWEADRASR